MSPPEISLVVPALNEALNLPELARQVHAALGNRHYELLIVDDNSKDATPQVCAELSKQYPLRLIVRTVPKDGLGGAVLHGFSEARGKTLVVMDADLQHPPAKLPELIAPLESGKAEFTLGSRYVPGGSTGEKWGWFRKINSYVATWLARPFAGKVTDPMSGFFGLTRAVLDRAEKLTPLGYKIGLELMCKCRVANVLEVPIHFAERTAGESKMNLKEQVRYLEHLSRLYDFTYPRLTPISKFLVVMGISWFASGGLALGLRMLDFSVMTSVAWSYSLAILVTAVFHARYVRTQREFLFRDSPWRDFFIVSAIEWVACGAVTWYMATHLRDPHVWNVFLWAFTATVFVRYVLRKEFLFDVRGLRHEPRAEEIAKLKERGRL
jgi:dolichol-phosphate mannosyltransferase